SAGQVLDHRSAPRTLVAAGHRWSFSSSPPVPFAGDDFRGSGEVDEHAGLERIRLLGAVLDQELTPELEGPGVALERTSPYRHQHELQIGAPAHLALFDHPMLLVRDPLDDRLQALGTLRPALGIARPTRSEAGTRRRFPVADALFG